MIALTFQPRRAFAYGARGPGLDVIVSSSDGGESWMCTVTTTHPSRTAAFEQALRAAEGRKENGGAPEPTGHAARERLETSRDGNVAGRTGGAQ